MAYNFFFPSRESKLLLGSYIGMDCIGSQTTEELINDDYSMKKWKICSRREISSYHTIVYPEQFVKYSNFARATNIVSCNAMLNFMNEKQMQLVMEKANESSSCPCPSIKTTMLPSLFSMEDESEKTCKGSVCRWYPTTPTRVHACMHANKPPLHIPFIYVFIYLFVPSFLLFLPHFLFH